MLKQGNGCIVNMASVSGHKGFAEVVPSTNKHAIIALTRVAALGMPKTTFGLPRFLRVALIRNVALCP